jgi:hypothetical protein
VSGAQAAADATATHGTAEMAPAKATAHMSAAAEPAAYVSAAGEPAAYVSAATEPTGGERKRVSGQSPTESGSRHQGDHGLT